MKAAVFGGKGGTLTPHFHLLVLPQVGTPAALVRVAACSAVRTTVLVGCCDSSVGKHNSRNLKDPVWLAAAF